MSGDGRVSTAFLEHQRDNINRHAASGNYDPPGETDDGQTDSGPQIDRSMSALAYSSELRGRADDPTSDIAPGMPKKVQDWIQSQGYSRGTTLHIKGYKDATTETVIYGPNKEESLTLSTTEQAFQVPKPIRSLWKQARDSDPRDLITYANDYKGTNEFGDGRHTDPQGDLEVPGKGEIPESVYESEIATDSRTRRYDLSGVSGWGPMTEQNQPSSSDSSNSGDSMIYPDKVNTPLEREAWRKAGGDEAEAQRILAELKAQQSSTDSTETDSSDGNGLTTTDNSDSDGSTDSTDSSDSTGSRSTDQIKQYAPYAIGAAAVLYGVSKR